jgi:hypothetical protein
MARINNLATLIAKLERGDLSSEESFAEIETLEAQLALLSQRELDDLLTACGMSPTLVKERADNLSAYERNRGASPRKNQARASTAAPQLDKMAPMIGCVVRTFDKEVDFSLAREVESGSRRSAKRTKEGCFTKVVYNGSGSKAKTGSYVVIRSRKSKRLDPKTGCYVYQSKRLNLKTGSCVNPNGKSKRLNSSASGLCSNSPHERLSCILVAAQEKNKLRNADAD